MIQERRPLGLHVITNDLVDSRIVTSLMEAEFDAKQTLKSKIAARSFDEGETIIELPRDGKASPIYLIVQLGEGGPAKIAKKPTIWKGVEIPNNVVHYYGTDIPQDQLVIAYGTEILDPEKIKKKNRRLSVKWQGSSVIDGFNQPAQFDHVLLPHEPARINPGVAFQMKPAHGGLAAALMTVIK